MIKFTRLTNATRNKLRPPLLGIRPDAAFLAHIPQVRKNKPTRKPASAPAPTAIPSGTSGKSASTPIPAKPAANGHVQDRANALDAPATWRKDTPSIRSSRLAPGPNRNKLFNDRSVPGVRSIPDRPEPIRPSQDIVPPRPGAPAEEKPLLPKGPGRKTPEPNGTPIYGKENGSPRPAAASLRNTQSPQPPSTSGAGESKNAPQQAVPNVPDRENRPVPPAAKAAPKPAPKDETHKQALEQLLARHPDLPAQTAVLGVCDDGLPVLFDLFDPAPGALAIIGDEREAQLQILRSIIRSTAMRNTPRGVQFVILSMQPESWQRWIAEGGYDRYCLAITDVSDESVREWTLRMADWTEQRRLGQTSGPPVLMIMDTLSFLPKMAYDVRLNFDWMAKEGPPAAIWPLAAISSELALALGSRMLRGFQSRIFGYANDPSAYTHLANVTEEQAATLRSPGSFAVQVGENWLCFHLPEG